MKVWKGIVVLVALVVINLLMSYIVWRWDMTDDKRYSISAPTKALLQDLDAPLTITLLLDGEMNAGFLRLPWLYCAGRTAGKAGRQAAGCAGPRARV